ncbi:MULTISPECIES: MAPEG family protein [unclassified Pseudomonas]|uniref:MAPEG family protein n=1 Tax=unclassified Pseudomonas TaxID=196821 RepID=UPI0013048784|nr:MULTISPECIES: MAPEG family protein [unclassified Pseudomonas]
MKVTLLYGGLLAILFIALSARVIIGRMGPGSPSLGDGGNSVMFRRIRGHGNFAEYVPLALVLIGFLELTGSPQWQLHTLGSVLLVGRILHGYALSFTDDNSFGRNAGIFATLLVLSTSAVLCICRYFGGV